MSQRQCWICLGEERQAGTGTSPTLSSARSTRSEWVSPCKCTGSTRWVHQQCLLAWLASTHPGMETTPLLAPRNAASPGLDTPAMHALQHAAFFATAAPRCPQCHAPYRVVEDTVLPRKVMAVLQRTARAAEGAVLSASVFGAAAGAYVLAATYGLAVLCAVRAETPGTVVAAALAGISARPTDAIGALRTIASLSRLVLGLPLVPLYALSLGHPRLSVLYPLVPVLVYGGPGSLSLRAWPPATTAAALPLGALLYEHARRAFFSRIARSRTSGEASPMPSVLSLPADSTPATETAEGTPDTAEMLAAEEEEERVIRRSVMDTAAALVMPFAAAATGALLFSRLPVSLISRPVNRAVLGGLILLLARDAIATVAALQRRLSRATRRVLDHPS